MKSGRTDEAGGCDVLALTFEQGGLTRIIYAVVLGQRGGDLLDPGGRRSPGARAVCAGDIRWS